MLIIMDKEYNKWLTISIIRYTGYNFVCIEVRLRFFVFKTLKITNAFEFQDQLERSETGKEKSSSMEGIDWEDINSGHFVYPPPPQRTNYLFCVFFWYRYSSLYKWEQFVGFKKTYDRVSFFFSSIENKLFWWDKYNNIKPRSHFFKKSTVYIFYRYIKILCFVAQLVVVLREGIHCVYAQWPSCNAVKLWLGYLHICNTHISHPFQGFIRTYSTPFGDICEK